MPLLLENVWGGLLDTATQTKKVRVRYAEPVFAAKTGYAGLCRRTLRLAEDQIEFDRVAAIHRDRLALARRSPTGRHDG